MRFTNVRNVLAIVATVLIIHLPVLGANAPLGKVLPRTGSSQLNGNALALETTVFSGDAIATEADSLALIQLSYGDQISVGPATAVQVFEDNAELLVSLEKGAVRTRSGNARLVAVNARGLMVRPSGPVSYDVAIDGNAVYVVARQGSVEVHGANNSFVIPADKAMKFELAANTAPGTTGVGAANFTPGQGAIIGAAAGVGTAIVTYLIEQNDREDGDQAVCEEIKDQLGSVSPSSAAASIDCTQDF